jgi:catechol 2,3-dioxygenase-like lactoylglutathione lyase family enzyme
MIDHLEITVGNLICATEFYARALAPIRYRVHVPGKELVGLGSAPDCLDFWLRAGIAATPRPHFAFHCETREEVTRAYAAALEAGGEDCGAPALLPHIHPSYFAAFVRDPDGHKLELACHRGGVGS